MSMKHERPVCGRCHVYQHLHPTERCQKPRRSFWWDEHNPIGHAVGAVWLALSDRQRFAVVRAYERVRPGLCWCDLVDAIYLDVKKVDGDYHDPWGCSCDVPLPTDARPVGPHGCYCTPPNETTPTTREDTTDGR